MSRERAPHAVLDETTRIEKAAKIKAILGECAISRTGVLLEIGTGSGVIASELSKVMGEVHAVDVVDQRLEKSGYNFCLVKDTKLPYEDDFFDVVITNHVIEHVGNTDEQRKHLDEIRRVMRPDALCYFAVPNKWRIVEPHFRLPFLSWFPQALSDLVVRLTGKGEYYDCNPLDHFQAIKLFHEVGFDYESRTLDAMTIMLHVESTSLLERLILRLPLVFRRILYPIIPTMIFVLKPSREVTFE